VDVDRRRAELGVRHPLALDGPGTRRAYARCDDAARLAVGAAHQFLGLHGRHLDLQVDAVEQRSRQPSLVTRDQVGRAAALLRRASCGTEPAAGAGVHRRDELEAGRKRGLASGARNRDAAGLERLAQRLQRGARHLRGLVEEQYPAVSQRDLARPRWRAAAHQSRRAGAVVGAAERAHFPMGRIEGAAQTGERCAGQRLGLAHRRQQAGQALRQHRLAGAGRADHQEAVRPRGSNFERALGAGLATHGAKVAVGPLRRAVV
jgi:hypothetical protein